MIKDFLIINCTGKNDKIGLKINNNFFIHDFQTKIKNNEILVSTILNLINKYKANIDENFTVLVNNGPGSFSTIRVALAVAKGIKISNNIKLFGFRDKDLSQFNLENIEVLINKNLIEALTDIIYKMGSPKQTYMDIEGSTTSKQFINWITNTKKIKHVTTATHAHTVERFNRTLKENMVKRLEYENKGREKWTEQLNYVLNKYNNTVHSTIEITPKEATLKRNEMVVKFNLWNNAKRNRKYPDLSEGSNVRTIKKQDGKKKGYDPKWSKQVYKVVSVDGVNYTIDETNPSKKKTFNRYELLKV